MGEPTIEEIVALNGKIFAMLKDREIEVLKYYQARGRKFGVSVMIRSEADPAELARAKTQEHAEQIMRRANSCVVVTIGKGSVDES